jgi:hypothetical protein
MTLVDGYHFLQLLPPLADAPAFAFAFALEKIDVG